jgi:hypothetical protein
MECVDYIYDHFQEAIEFQNRPSMYDEALKSIKIEDGLIAEFGVWRGESINYFASKLPNRTIFGFDSFEGLHEDWKGNKLVAGAFDLGGDLPQVEKNVHLIKGWFHQTLPNFLIQNPNTPFSLVHIDSDTYEAARTIFDIAEERFVSGTVVIFDDYFGYRGWKNGEHKAWLEFCKKKNFSYKYKGFVADQIYLQLD